MRGMGQKSASYLMLLFSKCKISPHPTKGVKQKRDLPSFKWMCKNKTEKKEIKKERKKNLKIRISLKSG